MVHQADESMFQVQLATEGQSPVDLMDKWLSCGPWAALFRWHGFPKRSTARNTCGSSEIVPNFVVPFFGGLMNYKTVNTESFIQSPCCCAWLVVKWLIHWHAKVEQPLTLAIVALWWPPREDNNWQSDIHGWSLLTAVPAMILRVQHLLVIIVKLFMMTHHQQIIGTLVNSQSELTNYLLVGSIVNHN